MPLQLSRKQRRVLGTILDEGTRTGESRKELLSAILTSGTEANYGNPAGGHGTSAGWRQEIDTYGPVAKRRNVRGAARRYFRETDQAGGGKGMRAWELSQAVQRSAFPDRYDDRLGEARAILDAYLKGNFGSLPASGSRPWKLETGETSEFDAGGFEEASARSVVGQLIAGNRGTDSILFKTGLLTTEAPSRSDFMDTKLTSKIVQGRGGGGGGAGVPGGRSSDAGNSVSRMLRLAEAWDRKQVPYLWGGGHGSTTARPGQKVDCSGYVSAILGVSPRTSGGFLSWGKPGRGKQVTVWTNNGHVLIQIGRRWFATSSSNPGGGAGEISKPSGGYLSAFTPRHPRGL